MGECVDGYALSLLFIITSVPKLLFETLNHLLHLKSMGDVHRPRILSPPPLCVAKTGRNNLNEEFTPLLPTGIGERF